MSASAFTINPLITSGCMVSTAGLGAVAAPSLQPAAVASPGSVTDSTPCVKSADEIMAPPKGISASSFWQLRLPFPISVPQRIIDRAVFVYGRMGVETTSERISAVSRDGSLFLLRDESGALALMDGDTGDGLEPLYLHEHFLPSVGKYFREGRLLEAELIARDGDVILINVEEKGEMAWREDAATGRVQKISAHYFPRDEILFQYGEVLRVDLLDRSGDCLLLRKKGKNGRFIPARFNEAGSDRAKLPDSCYFPGAGKYFSRETDIVEAIVVTKGELSGDDQTLTLAIHNKLPIPTVILTRDKDGHLRPLRRAVYPRINLATDHNGVAHVIGSFRIGASELYAVGIPESVDFRGDRPGIEDVAIFRQICSGQNWRYEKASKEEIRAAAEEMGPNDFVAITFTESVPHNGRIFDLSGDPERIAILVRGESGLEIADDRKVKELASAHLRRQRISFTAPDRAMRIGRPVEGEVETKNGLKVHVYHQQISMRVPFVPFYYPDAARRNRKAKSDSGVSIHFTRVIDVMIEVPDRARLEKRIRALMRLLKNTPFEAAGTPGRIEIYEGKSSHYEHSDEDDRSIYGDYSRDDVLRMFLFDKQSASGEAKFTLWHELGHGLINNGKRARDSLLLAIKASGKASHEFYKGHAPAGPAYYRFTYEEHGAESLAMYLYPRWRAAFADANLFMAGAVEYLLRKSS